MKRILLLVLVIVLYMLHQDTWFWRTADPLLFDLLPVGLTWHVLYTLAISLLMWLLVAWAWPDHLEAEVEPRVTKEDAAS